MTNRILVTYASRTGSTIGVAQAIAAVLTESGAQVDVLPMPEVKDLAPYQAVVAGSAIQAARWLPEAMEFIQSHKAVLNQKPFAAFLVCMTLAMEKVNIGTMYPQCFNLYGHWSKHAVKDCSPARWISQKFHL